MSALTGLRSRLVSGEGEIAQVIRVQMAAPVHGLELLGYNQVHCKGAESCLLHVGRETFGFDRVALALQLHPAQSRG